MYLLCNMHKCTQVTAIWFSSPTCSHMLALGSRIQTGVPVFALPPSPWNYNKFFFCIVCILSHFVFLAANRHHSLWKLHLFVQVWFSKTVEKQTSFNEKQTNVMKKQPNFMKKKENLRNKPQHWQSSCWLSTNFVLDIKTQVVREKVSTWFLWVTTIQNKHSILDWIKILVSGNVYVSTNIVAGHAVDIVA